MNHTIITFIFVVLSLTYIVGQDSIKVTSHMSIDTRGQHNLASLNKNFDCFDCLQGRITDNPIHHLAIYTGVNHLLTFNDKYSLETGIYLEERSLSGGNNTLSNLVIFPKIRLQVEDTLFKSRRLKYLIKGGDLWNEDVSDMLRLYNIDYQGIIGQLNIGKWSFGFMSIGDLSRNIGLDIHQLHKFSLQHKNTKLTNTTSITINELISLPSGQHPTVLDYNIGHHSKYNVSTIATLEGQVDIRLNERLAPSLACGMRFTLSKGPFSVTSSARYYSSNYNLGYNGDGPRYSGITGAYVGTQLYPLKNFYRPFSQWALYTHSQVANLIAFELNGSWNKKIYNKVSGFTEIDVNYLYDMDHNVGKIYPIYNAGVQFDFLSFFFARISATNKHMELQQYYQTFQISKSPFLSLSVHLQLEKIHVRTMYLK